MMTRGSSRLKLALLAGLIMVSATVPAWAQDNELAAGQTSFQAGQFEEALVHFDASVDAAPTNADSHLWRAKCLAALGRTKEAGGEYRMAMRLTSDKNIKAECESQLKQFNQPIPEGSIADTKKKFELDARKLDWNLSANARSPLNATLKAQDDQLAGLINGGMAGFRVQMGLNAHNLDAELQDGPAHVLAITAADRKQLINSDVVIILDHSGSMSMSDCPRPDPTGRVDKIPQPRLTWAALEMDNFAGQLMSDLPHGFMFITYDTRPLSYDIKSAAQFSSLLKSIKSGGGTTLAPALDLAFRHHLAHMDQPLVIAVVSDCEIDVKESISKMISATQLFPLPKGAFITYLQIGIMAEEPESVPNPPPNMPPSKFNLLTHLRQSGAAYEPATLVRFSKLRRTGFSNAMLAAMRAAMPPPPASKPKSKAP